MASKTVFAIRQALADMISPGSSHPVSYGQLAYKLGVSPRTIRRNIRSAVENEFEIESQGPGRCYRIVR